MKKILFPTDCSASAHHAFRFAVQLARQLDAVIDIMSVYHLPATDASSVPPSYIETMIEERRRQVEANVAKFLEAWPDAPIGQRFADYGIFTHQEIVDKAVEGGHELIVMGTHGVGNAVDKLLGSVTTHTIMQAPCPVLAIPPGAEWKPIRHIAYATDFEAGDGHAVYNLMEFAKLMGAQVHFVHIHTDDKEIGMEELDRPEAHPEAFADFTIVHNPSVMDGLDQYVRERSIDMVALFIPRRRMWERLFHSSFSKKMAFHTALPLLTFRA